MNEINRSAAETSADPQGAAPADPSGASPAESAADTAAALAAAQAKAQENWNAYLRGAAEFENFRKRSERELDNARKFAVERFAQDLVSVADALEAAIASAGGAEQAHLEGVRATLRQLYRAFEKAGIQVVDPAGRAFDPAWHEAMLAQDAPDVAPDTVLSVVQKGYSLNGRLLRPARVVVSRAPAQGGN